MREFLRKIIRNKMIVLTVSIILICVLYFVARKIIDNYEAELYSSDTEVILEDAVAFEEKMTTDNDEMDEKQDGNGGDRDSGSDSLETENDEEIKEEEDVKEIFVHIAGEVNNPGVVLLHVGARIIDAINVAGGTTPNADISDINLAYVLKDGMKVNVPNKNDVEKDKDYAYVSDGSGNEAVGDSARENEDTEDTVLCVNINTATQTELESLPGIGPSIALKIIKYRDENGKFSSIDELKNVSGIGEAKFEALRDFIVCF